MWYLDQGWQWVPFKGLHMAQNWLHQCLSWGQWTSWGSSAQHCLLITNAPDISLVSFPGSGQQPQAGDILFQLSCFLNFDKESQMLSMKQNLAGGCEQGANCWLIMQWMKKSGIKSEMYLRRLLWILKCIVVVLTRSKCEVNKSSYFKSLLLSMFHISSKEIYRFYSQQQ